MQMGMSGSIFEAPLVRGQEQEYIRWGPRGTPIQGLHQGTHRITAEQLENDFYGKSPEADRQRLWEAEDARSRDNRRFRTVYWRRDSSYRNGKTFRPKPHATH